MENDRTPTDDGWFYAPAPPDTNTFTDLGTFNVDGEVFVVRRSDAEGTTLYDWVSGPNDGYGFNTFGGTGASSREQHVASIRDFLAGIDAVTGFLRDP